MARTRRDTEAGLFHVWAHSVWSAELRRDTEAGLFHVWAHSVWSAELFRDDLDRSRFVSELARTTQRVGWRCVGVCLLTSPRA